MQSSGKPIRNPVTAVEHAASIQFSHGFDYRVARIASGTSKTTGKVALDLKSSHAHFANIHPSNRSIAERA